MIDLSNIHEYSTSALALILTSVNDKVALADSTDSSDNQSNFYTVGTPNSNITVTRNTVY